MRVLSALNIVSASNEEIVAQFQESYWPSSKRLHVQLGSIIKSEKTVEEIDKVLAEILAKHMIFNYTTKTLAAQYGMEQSCVERLIRQLRKRAKSRYNYCLRSVRKRDRKITDKHVEFVSSYVMSKKSDKFTLSMIQNMLDRTSL